MENSELISSIVYFAKAYQYINLSLLTSAFALAEAPHKCCASTHCCVTRKGKVLYHVDEFRFVRRLGDFSVD